MLAAILMFTLMDAVAKHLSTRIDTVQALWARYTFQMVVVSLLIAPRARTVLRTRHPWLQLFRAVALLGATGFFFYSLKKMSLVEVTAIMQISPIFIMLGAAVFLGERFGQRRAIAAVIALAGALIVLRPGTEAFTSWALLPIAGTLCYSSYALATRYAGRDEDVWTSLFYTATVATIVLSLAVPSFWQPLNSGDIAPMILVGVFGTLGQLLLIRSFSLAQASVLAPFSYTALIWSSLWGIVFFGSYPDLPVYLGALVIVAAGLYVWHRETTVKAN
ncbi:MAG: DMT family transporter [Litoreibacter sp.]|nr:DMT family transporter [Litoreibacter sp.]